MWTGLILRHAPPRRPASYGASSAFTITPSWPAPTAWSRKAAASAGSAVTIDGSRAAGRHDRCEQLAPDGQRFVDDRRATGVQDVEEVRRQPVPTAGRCIGTEVAHRVLEPPGQAVLGRRRAPRRRARGRHPAARPRAPATAPRRSVISLRLRVKMRTSPSRRWAWIRAPSSFHSTDAGPVAVSAASTSAAGVASIGCTARPGHHPDRRQRVDAACRARRQPCTPRSPASMWARRTAAIGTPAALATASTITPSSAPWRSSPPRTSSTAAPARTRWPGRTRRPAAPRRAALTPAPDIAASRVDGVVDLERPSSDGVGRRLGPHVAQRRPPDADAALAQGAGEHADRDGAPRRAPAGAADRPATPPSHPASTSPPAPATRRPARRTARPVTVRPLAEGRRYGVVNRRGTATTPTCTT